MTVTVIEAPPLLLLLGSGVGAAVCVWLLASLGVQALVRWRREFTQEAGFRAREFFLFVDPRQLFAVQLVVMALFASVAWLVSGSVVLAMAVGGACALLPRWLYRTARRQRLRAFDAQLPDGLLLMAGALRAGVGLGSALQQLVVRTGGPLGQEFTLVLREQRLGVSMDDALAHLGRRVPTDSSTLMVSALRIAGDTGGALAETLERTAATVRARQQMEGKIDALTAQGRLQAWVVGALPLVLLAVLQRMEPRAMALMWTTPAGWAALTLVAVLLVLGVVLIRRIVAIDV